MPEELPILNAYLRGESRVVLISRHEGKRVTREVPAEWVGYLAASAVDEKLRREIQTAAHVKSLQRQGDFFRVGFVNRSAREDFCMGRKSFVAHLGIDTFEADVRPEMRHVIDSKAKIGRPRRVYLDLETDSRVPFSRKEEMRILSWALVDSEGRAQVGVLKENTDRAERDLLAQLWKSLDPFDQVVAWNGDGFDFPVLFARTDARGIQIEARQWLWLDHLVAFRRMNMHSAESGEEKQSMRLNDIAQATLGDGKEESPPEVKEKFGDKSLGALSWQLWEAGGDFRDILVRYNHKDTDLLRRIEKKTGYLALLDTLCEATNTFADTHGLDPTRQMDGFMMALGSEKGARFPTKKYREFVEQYAGAFVMEPKGQGIHRNVHVCDFSAMYPSIILSWNMSPDTKVSKNEDVPSAHCPLTNVYFRTDKKGLLTIALAEMLRLRKSWNDAKASLPPGTPEWYDADRRSNAYKVAANSFYGVLGSPFSRFFDRQIAESITQNGAWLIKKTIEAAEARDMRAVYGDTDSCFIAGATREDFAAFVKWCNEELYPQLLDSVGAMENHVKLAYEKQFDRLVMTSAKRYVANYLHYKGKASTADSKPEIKGLEYKRGDVTILARKLQAEVIDLLVGGLKIAKVDVPTVEARHFHDALTRARHHVLEEPIVLAEVKLSKSLSQPLKEYVQKQKKDGTDASQPPHVTIAKILEKRGEDVGEGTRIEYLVTDGGSSPLKAIPASDFDGTNVDRYYVWEKLVYPPTQRLLEAAFPDVDWKGWLKVRPKKPRAAPKARHKATAKELSE